MISMKPIMLINVEMPTNGLEFRVEIADIDFT